MIKMQKKQSTESLRLTFLILLFCTLGLGSQSYTELPPGANDLQGQDKSVRQPPARKDKKGCCKIKYPAGGYDFFLATEEACRSSLYFDRFLGENNTLCFRWEED
ncbi:LIC_11321 family protein [Leptospira ognonensis]|uniref:LIC_11321 family protein n=1 Tax=Leptospira ognonensis TaxID=2484945 RepID=UPI003CCC51A0